MDTKKTIAPHETFELHELITLKNISATKSFAMSVFVKDHELKEIMQQYFRTSQEQIKELCDLLEQSEFSKKPAEATGMH